MRAASAILSGQNLLHNVKILQSLAPNSQLMAMIKANAYGHGLQAVALRLAHCVDKFGVASIDEGLILRQQHISNPIMLMAGIFERNELEMSSLHDFEMILHCERQVTWLESTALRHPIKTWIKVDTGMGRLGFNVEHAIHIYARMTKCANSIKPSGVMSHFACADNQSHPLNQQQLRLFKQFIQGVAGAKSMANSAAIYNFPASHYDLIRPGLAIYGISPIQGKLSHDLNLRPVMTLQTKLIAIKQYKQGTQIGYGAQYCCEETMPIGIAAIGYGDGYPKSTKNGTPILVNNNLCKVIGRISMDMLSIDLRNAPDAVIGDTVTLWGKGLPIEHVSDYIQCSPYNLVTGIQSRVKHIWVD